MRIYTLTPLGASLAKSSPSGDLTPNWSVIYFIRRRGGRATDDQIIKFAGLEETQARRAMTELVRINPPVVTVSN